MGSLSSFRPSVLPRSRRWSSGSTGSASPAAPTSTRWPTARTPATPSSAPPSRALDAFELGLARAADGSGLPVLGVCRGAQALNVARGGTLHQHVAGHRQTEQARCRPIGDVATARTWPRSWAPASLDVNCFHHQAVDRPGTRPARHRARARRDRRGHRGPPGASSSASSGMPRRCARSPRARRALHRAGPGRRRAPAAPGRRGLGASRAACAAIACTSRGRELGQRRALGGLGLPLLRRIVLLGTCAPSPGLDAAPRRQ